MLDPTWTAVLPPVVAIVLAITTRQVYLSLAAGTWLGWTILADFNPLRGLAACLDGIVAVFADAGNTRMLLFMLVIGALIATVEASGGVQGFVRRLEHSKLVTSPRRVRILAFLIGVIVFIESTITILVVGAIGRPLFDRYKISREKLAYLCDSTSAPICMMIPLNAWGAYVLGILASLKVERPIEAFAASIPYNFYAIVAIIVAAIVALWNWDFGPMRAAEKRTQGGELLWPGAVPMVDADVIAPAVETTIPPRARNMLVPIGVMVAMMPISLWATGRAKLSAAAATQPASPASAAAEAASAAGFFDAVLAGSGSVAVLWSVLTALFVAWLLLLAQRAFTINKLTRIGVKGAGGLVGLALLMLLALALAAVTTELRTGPYIARLTAGTMPTVVFLPLVFVVASVVGFCTGTSWGTFAIMLPIAVPAAQTLGLPLGPFIAAALSGGVFGDHASPISDTTIISSMAAATDHIDHVRTQLPYAVLAAAVAAAGFAVVGAVI
jgi:Na+/H+ antiporter NhaC